MTKKDKPFGIVATTFYILLVGIILIPTSFMMFMTSQFSANSEISNAVNGIYCLLLGLILLTASYGLWTIQEWGRKVTFWVLIISIPLNILLPTFSNQKATTGNIIIQLADIAVSILIVFYLSRTKVKAVFSPVKETRNNIDRKYEKIDNSKIVTEKLYVREEPYQDQSNDDSRFAPPGYN